jgi:hypothetical protein
LPVILIAVFALSMLSACSGSNEFTFTAETTEIEIVGNVETYQSDIAPAPGGYYLLTANRNFDDEGNQIYSNIISFADDAGIRRSKILSEYVLEDTLISQQGVWYKDGRIYTAYTIVPLDESEMLDIVFEVYDENFNLIKSVKPGSVARWCPAKVVFDGEYFYYTSDNPKTGQDVPYPNSDAIIYRLNTEFELVDSVNPTDKPTDPAGILQLFVGGDGKVYTVYFEEYFFGTRYKMKPYGENEKPVIIDGNLLNTEIATQGDSNFITYYINESSENYSELGIFGIKPNGDTERIEVVFGENEIQLDYYIILATAQNDERVSIYVRNKRDENKEWENELVKTVFKPAS